MTNLAFFFRAAVSQIGLKQIHATPSAMTNNRRYEINHNIMLRQCDIFGSDKNRCRKAFSVVNNPFSVVDKDDGHL
jgi:hypothetical protein